MAANGQSSVEIGGASPIRSALKSNNVDRYIKKRVRASKAPARPKGTRQGTREMISKARAEGTGQFLKVKTDGEVTSKQIDTQA